MKAYERLLKYVKIDTESDPVSEDYPSTPGQVEFMKMLAGELASMEIESRLDEYGYLIAKIKANKPDVPKIALIAHVDTSPDASGKNVNPRIIKHYDGGKIGLNKDTSMILDPEVFPSLKHAIGQDLITTDGTTLLGADDKAGVAEVMTVAEYLTTHPETKHGEIILVFTPDEEVGNGTKYIDVAKIGADFAFTLDGSQAGEISFENFNAAAATVTITGRSVHPGEAKGKMLNSISVAAEFDDLLPKYSRPETTEKYEGFNHLHLITGNAGKTVMEYIIRNHDKRIFENQKTDFKNASAFLNTKYGPYTCEVEIVNSYFNMNEKLKDHPEVINLAIEAIKECNIEPIIEPIRGGTDGARLTYLGLPCPNLGTGGYNYHGPYEYASIQEMDLAVDIVVKIIAISTK